MAAGAAAGAMLSAAACVPGTDGSGAAGAGVAGAGATAVPDPARAGKVTLTVWDQETRGGQNEEIQRLNREFEERYPNVRIKRVARSFSDLKTTLKLAISGNKPPDVIQANQGYPDMVAFVRAGLLTPLDNYAGIYAWNTRYPNALLNLNRVSADGTRFGTGRLYGISQTGEYIGVYYNKDLLAKAGIEPPDTWRELTAALPRLKKAGQLPVQFGNLDKYPAIHLFGVLLNQAGGGPAARETVLGRGDGFDTAPVREAARTLARWRESGYLPKGANGTGYDDAAKQFADGKGAFLITGTWQLADLKKTMGAGLGFMPPPPVQEGGPAHHHRGPGPCLVDHGPLKAPAGCRGVPERADQRARGGCDDACGSAARGTGQGGPPAAGRQRWGTDDPRLAEAERRRRPGAVSGLHHPRFLRHALAAAPGRRRRRRPAGRIRRRVAARVRRLPRAAAQAGRPVKGAGTPPGTPPITPTRQPALRRALGALAGRYARPPGAPRAVGYAYVLPALLLYGLFLLFPFGQTVSLSFLHWGTA